MNAPVRKPPKSHRLCASPKPTSMRRPLETKPEPEADPGVAGKRLQQSPETAFFQNCISPDVQGLLIPRSQVPAFGSAEAAPRVASRARQRQRFELTKRRPLEAWGRLCLGSRAGSWAATWVMRSRGWSAWSWRVASSKRSCSAGAGVSYPGLSRAACRVASSRRVWASRRAIVVS
jgi:hypothetical protein